MSNGIQESLASDYFRSIIASSIDGFTLINVHGDIIDVNDSYCQMIGYTREELLKMSMSDVDAIDSAEDVARRSEEIIQSGSLRFETKQRHKNGLIIDVEVSANYSPIHGGAFFFFVRDISERKTITNALINSEQNLKKLFDCFPIAAGWLDNNGNVIYLNQAFVDTFGYSIKEIPTLNDWFMLAYPDTAYRNEITSWYARNVESREETSHIPPVEVKITCNDGSVKDVIIYANQVLNYVIGVYINQTERKQFEKELTEKNIMLNSAASIAHLGTWKWNISDNTNVWSEELFRILGIPASAQPSHDQFFSAIHPDDHDKIKTAIDQTLECNAPYEVECRVLRPDGKIRYIVSQGQVQRDSLGQPLNMIGTLLDITKQKNAENALRESEQRNRLLAETMLHGLVYQDANGMIISMNPAAERILGKSHEEFIGSSSVKEEHFTIRENGEPFPGLEHPSMIALKSGLPVSAVVMGVYNPKRGEYRWISVNAVPGFRSGKTSPSEVYTLFEDITERKLAEETLKKREERYRILVETASEGILVAQGEHLKFVNPVIPELTGYTENELLTLPFLELIHPDYRELIRCNYIKRISGEVLAQQYEIQILCKDDNTKWVEISGAKIEWEGHPATLNFVTDITERKCVEQALFESEERFKNVLQDVTSIAVQGYGPDGTTQYWNKASENLYGYTAQESIGRNLLDLIIPPEMRGDVSQAIIYMAESGEPVPASELNLMRKDGSLVPVFSSHVIVKIPSRSQELFCLDIDLTEQKKAENALHEREQRLDFLLSSTPAVIYTCNYSGDYGATFVSNNVLQLTGHQSSQFIDDPSFWADHIHPDDKEKVFSKLTDSALHGGYVNEYRFLHQDGTYRWMHDENRLLRDVMGNPTEIIGYWADITEQKQVQDALAESEERYRKFSQLTTDFVFRCQRRTNEPFRLQWLGGASEKITGYSNEELFSKGCWLPIIHPEDQQRMCDRLFSFVSGDRQQDEFRMITKSGDIRWVSELSLCETGNEPDVLVLYGATQDITERKKAEEERHLLEQQFQQTQKLESLGVLAGGIAHDFNNILAVIIGRCALAKMNYETAEKHIPDIEKAAERAAELCRQMLAYAGKTQFVQTNVNMKMLLKDMVGMLRSTISQNVEIHLHISDTYPTITADESQIRQVVMNLIVNAAEAIGEADGEVLVVLKNTLITSELPTRDYFGKSLPEGNYLCLEVTDNGPGMDRETTQRIFEPFFTTKFAGRGLGLPAVLGIVTAHQGMLQLFSEPKNGTAVKIYLPVEIGYTGKKDSNADNSQSVLWQGHGTVLFVDDEEQIVMIASEMLKEIGFAVIEARNGKEALELYQNNASDIALVITDIGMPVMNGYDLIRELKTLNKELPIIVSSGFGQLEVSSRIAHEDVVGYVNKPYNSVQLREVLKGVVENKKRIQS